MVQEEHGARLRLACSRLGADSRGYGLRYGGWVGVGLAAGGDPHASTRLSAWLSHLMYMRPAASRTAIE